MPGDAIRGEIASAERSRSTSRATVAAGSRTAHSSKADSSSPAAGSKRRAERVVGERAGPALGVMDERDLEEGTVRQGASAS